MLAMRRTRKITVEIPEDLLRHTNAAERGVTETVRQALELLARHEGYERLRSLRGKVSFSIDYETMKHDR
jgi:hypothetical protein